MWSYNTVTLYTVNIQGKITNRPLAGTIRRGKTEKEDKMLEKELLNDAKQCAEHIMLVDLGRNDVGKVYFCLIVVYFTILVNFLCLFNHHSLS